MRPGAARRGAADARDRDVGAGAALLATVVAVSVDPSRPARRAPRSLRRAAGPQRARFRRAITLVLLSGMAGLAALVALFDAGPVAAQEAASNTLQSIEPKDGASLATSPENIVLAFQQEVTNDQTLVVVLGCESVLQPTGVPELDDNGLVFTVSITNPLPRGACTITWRLVDEASTEIASGFTTFRIDSDPVTTTSTTTLPGGVTPTTTVTVNPPTGSGGDSVTPAQGSSGGAQWLGRLLSTMGILALFGGLALIALGWPEGPEYVVTVRYLRTVWIVALVGTVLYLMAFAARFSDISFAAAMNPTAWFDLADAGWPGRGALLRLVFVAACGWVAMRPERIIDPTSAMWAWGLPAFALLATSLSRVEGPAQWIGVLIGFAHLLSTAVWFGGAAMVFRVVLAGPGEEDLVHATRAFARMSTKAMVAVVVTGAAQMARLVGNPFASSHGQVLLLKVVAVAAMLAVALAARQQVGFRLDRAHELTVPLADRFRRAFGAEAAIGVVVLMFSGWMLALTPAKVDPLAGQTYGDPIAFVDNGTGIEAKVFVGPQRVGLNGFKIEVAKPAEGITMLEVRFIPPTGAAVPGYRQPIPLTTSGTAYLTQANGLNFQAAGNWTVELVATTATGNLTGARGQFTVANADGTPPAVGTVVTTPTGTNPQISVVQQPETPASFVTTAPPTSATTSAPPSSTTG